MSAPRFACHDCPGDYAHACVRFGPARYAWTITRDALGDEPEAVGVTGPRGAAIASDVIASQGVPFRMKDDDGAIYYEGAFIGDAGSVHAFAPLEDYGAPNAGCTSIEYRDERGAWVAL